MNLRSGQVTGPRIQLAGQSKLAFEEGVRQVFMRWTALCLAVENGWGGTNSREKSLQLMQYVVDWFQRKKEHFADELEEELDSALENDFNVEAEDDSPHEVARSLVKIYGECLAGDYQSVDKMMSAAAASGAQQSQCQVLDRDGTVMEGDESGSSSGDEDSEDEEMETENGQAAPQGAPIAQQQQATVAPAEPVVDADGFTLVAPGRRKGKR